MRVSRIVESDPIGCPGLLTVASESTLEPFSPIQGLPTSHCLWAMFLPYKVSISRTSFLVNLRRSTAWRPWALRAPELWASRSEGIRQTLIRVTRCFSLLIPTRVSARARGNVESLARSSHLLRIWFGSRPVSANSRCD
jgi:hypothetical protein